MGLFYWGNGEVFEKCEHINTQALNTLKKNLYDNYKYPGLWNGPIIIMGMRWKILRIKYYVVALFIYIIILFIDNNINNIYLRACFVKNQTMGNEVLKDNLVSRAMTVKYFLSSLRRTVYLFIWNDLLNSWK